MNLNIQTPVVALLFLSMFAATSSMVGFGRPTGSAHSKHVENISELHGRGRGGLGLGDDTSNGTSATDTRDNGHHHDTWNGGQGGSANDANSGVVHNYNWQKHSTAKPSNTTGKSPSVKPAATSK